VVEGRKMSKSLGNFFTLRDLIEKGISPLAIRWVLIATHYRQPNNFSFEAAEAAKQSLNRIRDFRMRLMEAKGDGSTLEDLCDQCRTEFETEMDNDLNISGALGVVFNFIRDVNKALDQGHVGQQGAGNALALLDKLNAITGIFAPPADDEAPADIMEKVMGRQRARRERNFAEADRLRDEVLAAGWVIEDTPKGPRVKKA
jgi:cysteinyl-tRNA synthetase